MEADADMCSDVVEAAGSGSSATDAVGGGGGATGKPEIPKGAARSGDEMGTSAPAVPEVPVPPDDGKKMCKRCRKRVLPKCFDLKDCARCKACRSDETAFERRFPEAKDLKTNNTKEYDNKLALFRKSCPADSMKNRRRDIANLGSLRQDTTVKMESGSQRQAKTKMMWEKEYYEEASKTYMGNLTEEEAKRNWARWKNDPKVLRDEKSGPHGFLLLEVVIGHYGSKYEKGSVDRSILHEDMKKKKATEEDFEQMLANIVSGHDTLGGLSNGDALSAVFDKMEKSSGGAQSSRGELEAGTTLTNSSFSSEGLVAPSWDDLVSIAENLKSKKGKKSSDSTSTSAQHPEDYDADSATAVEASDMDEASVVS